jgi:hypothetical protein
MIAVQTEPRPPARRSILCLPSTPTTTEAKAGEGAGQNGFERPGREDTKYGIVSAIR